jgi:APA family basic amino acid/polyamine antiporter
VALAGWPAGLALPLAAGAVILLTLVNIVGVAPGAYTQNVFTVLKLAAIAVLAWVAISPAEVPAVAAAPSLPAPSSTFGALAVALVPILFSYGGWQQTNYIAEEIRDPERTLPRALILGVVIVVTVYLLVNLAYLRTLGVEGLAASTAPAADTMGAWFGDRGRRMISAGIVISTFGFLDLVILVSPRVYQAMAADGLFPAAIARLHPRTRTPINALVLQGAWALTLMFLGTYGELLDWVVFADWITFGAVALTMVWYRRSAGPDDRGFRDPLYPWSVALFVGAALYVVAGSVASNPGNALKGVVMIALGVPVYLFWQRRAQRA